MQKIYYTLIAEVAKPPKNVLFFATPKMLFQPR